MATLLGIAPSTLVFATLGANALEKPVLIAATEAAVILGVGGAAGAAILRRRQAAQHDQHPPAP